MLVFFNTNNSHSKLKIFGLCISHWSRFGFLGHTMIIIAVAFHCSRRTKCHWLPCWCRILVIWLSFLSSLFWNACLCLSVSTGTFPVVLVVWQNPVINLSHDFWKSCDKIMWQKTMWCKCHMIQRICHMVWLVHLIFRMENCFSTAVRSTLNCRALVKSCDKIMWQNPVINLSHDFWKSCDKIMW